MDNAEVMTIGYVMKPTRAEDFAKRGALPTCPTANGLVFVPLTFDLPLASQIPKVDAVLHKATDEIVSIDLSSPLDFPMKISFSKGMHELERYIHSHPDCYMIDPLINIYPLLDRHEIQQILLELEGLNIRYQNRLRAPHFLRVDNFQDPRLREQLAEAKLSLPVIVKPQVACGVADAHNMALVFKVEDFEGRGVPLPAIAQAVQDYYRFLTGIPSCLNYPIVKSPAPFASGNIVGESSFVVVSKSDLEGYEADCKSGRIWELSLVYRVQFAGQAALASLSCFWLRYHGKTAVLPDNKLGRESCSSVAEQLGLGHPCLVSGVVVKL